MPRDRPQADAHHLARRLVNNPERQLVCTGATEHTDRRLALSEDVPVVPQRTAQPPLLEGPGSRDAARDRIDFSDQVSGDNSRSAGSPELHLCCSSALLFNTLELPDRRSLTEPTIIAEAMRLHLQEAGALRGQGMVMKQQCAMALNMALASAVIYPDHSAIVIIGSMRTDLISLTIMEGGTINARGSRQTGLLVAC